MPTIKKSPARRARKSAAPPRDTHVIRAEMAQAVQQQAEAQARLDALREEMSRAGNPLYLNGRELHGGLIAAPRNGSRYYTPDIFSENEEIRCDANTWEGHESDRRNLAAGLVFAKREDAIAFATAVRDFATGRL